MNRERLAGSVVLAALLLASTAIAATFHHAPRSPRVEPRAPAAEAESKPTSPVRALPGEQATPADGCGRAPATGPRGLPAPVIITTGCGRYEVTPLGRVRTLPKVRPHRPGLTISVQGAGAARVTGGRIVITSGGETVWASTQDRYVMQDLGSVAVGPGGVAFSFYGSSGGGSRASSHWADRPSSTLFLAGPGGPERRVGRDEEPVAWTSRGPLLVSRWRSEGQPDLVLLDRSERLVRVLARRAITFVLDRTGGRVLFVTRAGRLEASDGAAPAALADLARLGFRFDIESLYPSLQVLGDGRLAVAAPDRLVVLDRSGALQSSAAFRVPGQGYGWIGSQPGTLTVDLATGDLVFMVTRWLYTQGPRGWKGWEGIYDLPTGASSARLLWGKPLFLAVCAHFSSLAWHGRWVLYAACEGRVVAIDVNGRRDPVDLSSVGQRLPAPADERAFRVRGAHWA